MRGLFVTFEGGEGAGKTTLVKQLTLLLQQRGLPVLSTRAPGGTEVGKLIRELLLHSKNYAITERCELYLFLADRAQHVKEVIRPALEKGMIVLCDRFNDSTIAYQGHARSLTEEKVAAECDFACEGLKPGCTFYLDISPSLGMQRVKKSGVRDRIEGESMEFHEEIRAAFLRIARREPERVFVLDAALPIQEVQKQAWEKLKLLLP